MQGPPPQAGQHQPKLLLIGDSGVGKTCLIMRFADDNFSASFTSTIGIDFKLKSMKIDGQELRLQIWDTAGQERFRTITSAYYRGAHGVMLVFDLTSAQSFTNVRSWMRNITEYAGKDVLKVLVGNKCDLAEKRAVPADKCESLAKEYDIPYFEVSAKAGTNVEEAFVNVATRIKREVIDALPASAEPVSVDKPVGSSKDWNRAIRMRGGSATTDGGSAGKATTSCCGS